MHRFLLHILFLSPAFLVSPTVSAATVVINEFQASNGETIADEDGDFEDWIELYNYGEAPVLLGGYGLSDDKDNPFRWVLPDIALGPGEFLLVFASNKDRLDGPFLHTNFAISSAGEEVLLTAPGGALIDFVPPTPIPRDLSFGRTPDGTGDWFFFEDPTPGTENTSEAHLGILDPPEFSHEGGFYTEEFPLVLSAPPGVTIRYTLDGSEPTVDSPEFIAPLEITSREGEPNLFADISTSSSTFTNLAMHWREPGEPLQKAAVLRAAAFAEGFLPSPVRSRTFFVHEDGADRYSFPVVSIVTDGDNLFGYERGIYHPGQAWDEAVSGNPEHWTHPANYQGRGEEWERPVHIELFLEDGALALAQDAGARIHGGASRAFPQKSLRLYARGRYGESHFRHPIFAERPYDSFKRLLLRNAGNDFTNLHFRDAFMQSLVADLPISTQAFRPSVAFVNGEYWGILHFRERLDHHYLATRYGVDPDNLDILEREGWVKRGDAAHYEDMIAFATLQDLADPAHFAFMTTQMDMENFIAYQTSQIYFRNTDWPENNIDFWRLRTSYQPDAPYGHDGRWRWMLFDTDFGFGYNGGDLAYLDDALSHAANPEFGSATVLLRNLLENEGFRHDFINQMADSLNTRFHPEWVSARLEEMIALMEPEIGEHLDRWHLGRRSKGRWLLSLSRPRNFAAMRPAMVRQHYIDYFDLEGTYELTIAMPPEGSARVRVNSIELEADGQEWSGIYFLGVPIEVEILPVSGSAFIGWQGDFEGEGPVLELTPGSDISLSPIMEDEAVSLQEVILPRFMQGQTPDNNDRVPYTCRLRIEGLLPNADYRYANRVVTPDDPPTQNGAGNAIYYDFATGQHFRTTDTPDFSEPGTYGEFTTDNDGVYEGWFTLEPSGNARFGEPELFIRVLLNDGRGGGNYHHFLTTANTVSILPFGFGWDEATGVYAISEMTPGNVAVLHDDPGGEGRPLAAALVKSVGLEVDDRYAEFYAQFVAGLDGTFGTLLPNLLPGGLVRIEEFAWDTAASKAVYTSQDGLWPDNADTVNPAGGLEVPIALDLLPADPALPGDVNGDGVVNAVDVQLVINAALGNALDPGFDADINGDGVVNAVDVQLVITYALGVAG